ncbi:MAG: hypothetical protein AVDCRST_MAG77-2709 [uncultured Chloroflexi bacterium]|uniref:DUF3558 domain-containing protein n=1 Tax=uncultured Chloroflexota bacterium TaxID=166587 RepID=A0A6J4IXA1_9CHLR|nr:MAG: hypothetical protein AVDCRST_MAG77-2709 [uncultured Chloroflexota bacterium]
MGQRMLTRLHLARVLAGSVLVPAACGPTSATSPASPGAAGAVAPTAAARVAPAQAGGRGCPPATRADASAALGKEAMEGEREGEDKCFFAAADTRTAPATEYVDVAVTKHTSDADARVFFEAASGRSGTEKLSGLGDAAIFTRDGDNGRVLVLKGRTSVLVAITSKVQADPRGALQQLAQAVLAKI